MLRSLFSGVSGMKNQQTKMDVTANNISNVNTTAFKSSRVTFKDMLSQTSQSASSPTTTIGGSNPRQVGLGMGVASIDTDMSQGALQPTGRSSDLAIQGNGFFIVSNGSDKLYTRDGSFTLDKNGDLLTSEGYHIVGQNKIDPTTEYMNIPLEHDVVPAFDLKDTATPPHTFKMKIFGFDGKTIEAVNLTNTADTKVTKINNDATVKQFVELSADKKTLTINTCGITDMSDLGKQINKYLSKVQNTDYKVIKDGTATDTSVKDLRDLLDEKGITGISMTGTLADLPAAGTANALSTGTDPAIKTERTKLTSYSVEKNGTLRGIYGEDAFAVGKIKTATFQNTAGLEKKGGNLYLQSANSGQATEGFPADNGYGTLEQGYLEMSKVDLANEFTDMIITSRAYQANSKTITTSDEMLQELINLKR